MTRWGLAAALLVAGCSYTSQYVAPADGRPRAVWVDNAVAVETAGAPQSDLCDGEIARLVGRAVPPPPASEYTPRYWGPPIIVTSDDAPVCRDRVFLPPSRFVPRLAGGSSGGNRRSFSLGNNSNGAALIFLVVAAILVVPAIAVGLSLAPAESRSPSSDAIDRVNAMNDLLRYPNSPCFAGAPQ